MIQNREEVPGIPEPLHCETVESVKGQMPGNDFCSSLADFFKILGDMTRVRILLALSFSEMCVLDISFLLGMTQSAISHQLRVLRHARLVKARKAGKSIFYSLDDEHVENIVEEGFEHLRHGGTRGAAG